METCRRRKVPINSGHSTRIHQVLELFTVVDANKGTQSEYRAKSLGKPNNLFLYAYLVVPFARSNTILETHTKLAKKTPNTYYLLLIIIFITDSIEQSKEMSYNMR